MKKLFQIISLLLLFMSPAWAAFTFVNAQGTNATSNTTLTTPTWSSTAGDTIIAVCATFTQTVSTISDSLGNSFTLQAPATNGSEKIVIGYLLDLPTGSGTYSVTCTATGGANEISLVGAEFTKPANTTVALDKTNNNTGNNTSATVSVGLVTANSLIIGAATPGGGTTAPTAGAGYTIPTNGAQPSNGDTASHQPAFLEYNLNGAGGTTTVNMTVGNGQWAIRGTSFKATANATNNCTRTLLGAGPC